MTAATARRARPAAITGRLDPASAPRGAPWVFAGLGGAVLLVATLAGFPAVVTGVAVLTEAMFVAFFLRHLTFAMAALRSAPGDLRAPVVSTQFAPPVSVLVACKNEDTVIDGLLRSLLALEYEPDRIQLVVVDDASDDRTAARLEEWGATEPRLTVLHRQRGAAGGKSGALNEGLSVATGEIIVVFDADHRPRTDVVRRLVRHFEDPAVGAVQGRCEIANADASPLTRLIAVDYMAGYLVNEYGRQCLWQLPAYGGANCAVRASSLRSLGGWNPDTVTEDTDLTLRLLLEGQRVRYDVTAVDLEEGVVTLRRYWRQRYRWARGHQQVWRDFRRAVWRSRRLSALEKIETTMFLLAFHVPVVSAVGLGVLLLWTTGVVAPAAAANVSLLWALLFLGPLLELGAGLLIARADRRDAFTLIWFLPMFFVSIALCAKAWFDGIVGRVYTWEKTRRSAEIEVATRQVSL